MARRLGTSPSKKRCVVSRSVERKRRRDRLGRRDVVHRNYREKAIHESGRKEGYALFFFFFFIGEGRRSTAGRICVDDDVLAASKKLSVVLLLSG